MRRRQMRHVIDFAIGGEPAVEGVTVPRSHAGVAVIRVFLGMIPFALDLVGLADLFTTAAARQAGAFHRHSGAGLNAVLRFGEIFLGRGALDGCRLWSGCGARRKHQRRDSGRDEANAARRMPCGRSCLVFQRPGPLMRTTPPPAKPRRCVVYPIAMRDDTLMQIAHAMLITMLTDCDGIRARLWHSLIKRCAAACRLNWPFA